jgi:hypothetical protein
MDAVLNAFFVWCCQFVVVSTLFLTTSYWMLGRARRRKLEQRQASRPASAIPSTEMR